MFEQVDEPVGVIASFSSPTGKDVLVIPRVMEWRKHRYRIDTFGLYHPARAGNKLTHVFQFSVGTTAFRVELDSETLVWTLKEAYHESGA